MAQMQESGADPKTQRMLRRSEARNARILWTDGGAGQSWSPGTAKVSQTPRPFW